DGELTPLARAVARGPDGAAVPLHQRADQVQADAQPALRPGVGLYEEVEDVRQDLRGEADPVVAHAQDEFAAVAPGLDPNVAARIGVLGRVRQQVDHDLF